MKHFLSRIEGQIYKNIVGALLICESMLIVVFLILFACGASHLFLPFIISNISLILLILMISLAIILFDDNCMLSDYAYKNFYDSAKLKIEKNEPIIDINEFLIKYFKL